MAIDNGMAREARRAALPSNVGKSWSSEEEASLVAAFKSGDDISTIAANERLCGASCDVFGQLRPFRKDA
jgi:hypothetical protein